MITKAGFGRNYGAVQDAEQKIPKCFSLWSTNEAEDFSLHSLIYRVSNALTVHWAYCLFALV
jgi:hypothetical protein